MSVSFKTSLAWRADHCLERSGQPMRRTMKPSIHVITLAVADLDRALAFYRDGLGFRTEGLIGAEFTGDETTPDGTTAVFHLDGGLMLSIYPRSELAKDADVPLTPAKPGEFSIGHAVASRAEVDEIIAQARAAGAAVTDSPHDRPWGIYSGYFQDPDGHLWEIIWNPALDLTLA
jgi:catechol 2,3-dioxygenase-like lactoylglutathione lyase family enzyme